MKATFIESSGFTNWVVENWSDEAYANLQHDLMANPEIGDVMKGCGGLRKVRAADLRRNKGKRGGTRMIYLYIAEARWFFMLDAYGKNEKDDLRADERKALARLAESLKRQASTAIGHGQGRT